MPRPNRKRTQPARRPRTIEPAVPLLESVVSAACSPEAPAGEEEASGSDAPPWGRSPPLEGAPGLVPAPPWRDWAECPGEDPPPSAPPGDFGSPGAGSEVPGSLKIF